MFHDKRLAQEEANKTFTIDCRQAPIVSPLSEELLAVYGHLGSITFIQECGQC